MITTTAFFPTAHGSKYMQQLCKHLAHKIEVRCDTETADAALPTGQARFRAAADGLHAEIKAEDIPAIIQARFVVDKHLVTFAFRDKFAGFEWKVSDWGQDQA